jgi:hypothetical protein
MLAPESQSSGNFQQNLRILGGNGEKCSRCAGRRATTLFPVLEGSDRHTEQFRESRLGQSGPSPDRSDVRHIENTAMITPVEFAQPLEDFLAYVALSLSHARSPA